MLLFVQRDNTGIYIDGIVNQIDEKDDNVFSLATINNTEHCQEHNRTT